MGGVGGRWGPWGWVVGLASALALVGCGGRGAEPGAEPGRVPLRISTGRGEVTLLVEVADDPAERARGLSGRERLPPDAGMAFLWDEPVEARFWMKDTLIPLQIAFWGEDGRILAVLDMEPCRADPCPTYGPDEPFIGAVEANAGWFTEHGVAPGDTVTLGERDA